MDALEMLAIMVCYCQIINELNDSLNLLDRVRSEAENVI